MPVEEMCMKKILAVCMMFVVLCALAGCGTEKAGESTAAESAAAESTAAESSPESTADASQPDSALALLTAVWDSYPEDAKFSVAGGDSEQYVMDAPGAFSVENPEMLDGSLAFPAAEADQIDEAASLMHMMNANNFTAGAFHLKDEAARQEVAEAVKANLDSRQWLCGFPEEFLIASVDSYVVCVFGTAENVETFGAQLTGVYGQTQVEAEGPVLAG